MLVFALPLLLAAAAPPAIPQASPVFRCRGARGELVLRGTPCTHGEMPPQAPAEQNLFQRQHAWGGRCPDTELALRERIAATFDTDDINALGGLILWDGYRSRAAYAQLLRLQSMLAKPLVDVAPATAFDSSQWPSRAAVDGPQALLIEVAEPGMGTTTTRYRFAVAQRDGCYWLRPEPSRATVPPPQVPAATANPAPATHYNGGFPTDTNP